MDMRLVSLWRLGTLGSEVSLYRSEARPRAASADDVGGPERAEVECEAGNIALWPIW